ncbi:hypothetical protein BST28_08265 [Mycolicibacter kumamotonensis]|uniref:DUF3631 domain-containing protein n=1 Tax=Mycolicibacter kumamotonensis TaxID=354243 RepID=A0A1X0E7X4_9MYCO|nr:DUF3631 domain-containing protein [Mycolicibacter kumamotonensis]ORA80747.1 hypothetical protein BST28_08265 [Mycolicibacter kumamotonensis]
MRDNDYAQELREWYAEDSSDGARLLDDTLNTFTRYVVFPDEHAAVGVVLWATATHAVEAFQHAPRLVINSPEKRCGKSRLLDVVAGTCHKPLMSVNATVAAIYRSIGDEHPPTLLVDEADTLFGSKKVAEQNEDLRALLNAGHQRGRPALRCVGPAQVPTEFPTFAMAALAGIGQMPDTITDRAVNITLRRRKPDEKVAQFRSRRDGPILADLRDRLAAWCATQLEALADAEPEMPVEDRAADTWEPLIAIADAAGGRWPELARTACAVLVARADGEDEDRSLGVRLLIDIREVFTERGVSFLSSADLVAELRKVDESPWDGFDLNPSKLAYRLREYKVKPGHNTEKTARGYRLEDLADVFSRYLRPKSSGTSKTGSDQQQSWDGLEVPDGSTCPVDTLPVRGVATRPAESAGQGMFGTGRTGSDGGTDETGSDTLGFTPPTGPGRCTECGWHVPKQGHHGDCQQTQAVVE